MPVIQSLIQNNEFTITIENARRELQSHPEWKERYKGYAKKIFENLDTIRSVRETFREWSPLKLYLNVAEIKSASKTVGFELRYLGQTVAELTSKSDVLLLNTNIRLNKLNERDFDCKVFLSNADWKGNEAKDFRSHFKNREPVRNTKSKSGNEEHRIESLFLTELSKPKDKMLPYVKPIKIANVRFPMPTPLSASNHKQIKYSGCKGGGIDIFARAGTGGKATNLCIMELKDENKKSEPPKDAVKQAVTYATFIRELLRSDSGPEWWKLFGFNGCVPEKLVIFAACVMPSNENNDKSFEGMELDVEGDIIKLQYVYFTEEHNCILSIDTSLNK